MAAISFVKKILSTRPPKLRLLCRLRLIYRLSFASGLRIQLKPTRACFKSEKACTNYFWASQNVLRNCWNNKNSSWVGDSIEEAAIKRERSFDKNELMILICEVTSWTERPDGSQNSGKLFCSLYERLLSTIIIFFFRRFWAKMSPAEEFSGI